MVCVSVSVSSYVTPKKSCLKHYILRTLQLFPRKFNVNWVKFRRVKFKQM